VTNPFAKWTVIEWLIAVSVVLIFGGAIAHGLYVSSGNAMRDCAETCGTYARPALLPDGRGLVTCACLPPGTTAVPYPVERP
jgi:hypothetical protein